MYIGGMGVISECVFVCCGMKRTCHMWKANNTISYSIREFYFFFCVRKGKVGGGVGGTGLGDNIRLSGSLAKSYRDIRLQFRGHSHVA